MDWIISGIAGLLIGGFFGVFAMAVMSGRAYDKGKEDGAFTAYYEGQEEGYRLAIGDLTVAERVADEVVFEGPDHTKIEGD